MQFGPDWGHRRGDGSRRLRRPGAAAGRQGGGRDPVGGRGYADKSTQTLMQAFYWLRESQSGLPKVEALRQAQLALLRGVGQSVGAVTAEVRGLDLVQAGSRATAGALPRFTSDAQAPYAHPFYWAPFLLIGNWR
jgi:CHAT domain-containing protein